MSSEAITYIVAPLVAALISGCAWLVKHYIEKSEERQRKKEEEKEAARKLEIEERNVARQKIQDDIAELKSEVKTTRHEVRSLQIKIMTCKHEDCPNKAILAEELEKEV